MIRAEWTSNDALSAEQATHSNTLNALDCISRQAAIEAIVNTISDIGYHDNSEVARYGATFRQHEIIDIINNLPSAQPEIIACGQGELVQGGLRLVQDLISRQMAIDACHNYDDGKDAYAYGFVVEERLQDLPSAQPERKKDIIQKFHDYQIEWLTSHCDLEFEPVLESWVVRFLHDTANCYMMEVEHE